MKVYYITGNKNKVKETQKLLKNTPISINQADLKLPEIQSKDVEKVAKQKVKEAFRILKKPLIAEDTGLYVKAFNQYPGAYIKHFLEAIGNEGILKCLENKAREAKAVCVIAYCDSKRLKVFKGEVEGEISKEVKGKFGFGFDSIFIPKGYSKTFAELDLKEKNKISHRGKAIKKFLEWVKN